MKRFRFSCYSIPVIYLGIWTICVSLIFLYGVQTHTIWLTAEIIPAVPQKLELPREHPMLESRQQKEREAAQAEQRAQQAQTAQAVPARGTNVRTTHTARSGRPVIGAPKIEEQKDAFGVSFDLGRDPSGEISIARQEKVAAWMISVPGQWVMTGPAYIETGHPLVSSILVLINNNRAKIKLFYRNPHQTEGKPPVVTMTDRGLHISLVD